MDNIVNGEPSGEGQDSQSFSHNQTSFDNEAGQITHVDSAEDIAYVEKRQGRDAALLREKALRFQLEEGLSEGEAENLEKVEVFAEFFPCAFEEGTDEKGFPVYVMEPRKVMPYRYDLIAKHIGGEKTDQFIRNMNSMRSLVENFDIGDKELQERDLPISTLFESFTLFNRRLTFSREGIRISVTDDYEKLNHVQRKAIPFDSLSKDRIKLLSQFLNKMNENGEIRREVDENIRKSRKVDTFKNIVKSSIQEEEELE